MLKLILKNNTLITSASTLTASSNEKNEDGTIRLILADGINNNATYKFNTTYIDYSYMYYTNSDTIKPTLDSWYISNLLKYIATGIIFVKKLK